MKLLLDIGNSRAKWAWLEGLALCDPGAAAHGGGLVAPVIDAICQAGHAPDEILVASVAAPQVTSEVLAALQVRLVAAARVAESEREAAGVRNGYRQPAQLGVDRWLAMLAAYNRHHGPVCVVDAGTALTIDFIDKNGDHHGGLIIPGLALMRQSLVQTTSRVGAGDDRRDQHEGRWGRDTAACIRQGSLLASARLVEGCMRSICDDGWSDVELLLTGGDGLRLKDELRLDAVYCPHLVLEGLALRFVGVPVHMTGAGGRRS